ncbi:hypothetical protein T08_872 [Trichinella sp. T8]|nr:hypothetical protein T08_872 [Trichinella sp. T8]
MAPPAGSNAENLKKHEEALKAFEKEDTLAQLILVSSMNDANVELTATSKSSAEIWQKRDGPTGAQLYSHSGPLFIYWSLSSLFY